VAGSCSPSETNNSVTNESMLIAWKSLNYIQHGKFPLRAARGNGTTGHNAIHLAARHKTTAGSRVDNDGPRGWQR
jgi:hypothetical protein